MERDLPIKPSGPAQCFALPCFFPVSSVECGSALLCRFCFPVSSVECGSGFATAALVFPFWSAAVLCSAAFVFLFLLWSAAVLCSAAFVFLFLLWSAAVLCSAAFVFLFLLWSAAGAKPPWSAAEAKPLPLSFLSLIVSRIVLAMLSADQHLAGGRKASDNSP